MANVKLTNKQKLEELQAKLVLKHGKKVSQQEILDKCINFTEAHFEQFISEEIESSPLTDEKKELILSKSIKCKIFYEDLSDDELLYGSNKI